MSCTSTPLADSPWRKVTAGAPPIVRVAVRFSGSVAKPIDRTRTAGSLSATGDGTPGATATAPAAGPAAAASGAAAGADPVTVAPAATPGEATTGGTTGRRRSTRARGGSLLPPTGTLAGPAACSRVDTAPRGDAGGSSRAGTGVSNARRASSAPAATTIPTPRMAHRRSRHPWRSRQVIKFPPAAASRGSRACRASRIVLTTLRPPGSSVPAGGTHHHLRRTERCV